VSRGISAADAVIEHAHFYAFCVLLREKLGKASSDLTLAEDERLDMNVMARRPELGFDRAERLRPVDQHLCLVSNRERLGGIAAHRIDQLAKGRGLIVPLERRLKQRIPRILRQGPFPRDDGRRLPGRLDARILGAGDRQQPEQPRDDLLRCPGADVRAFCRQHETEMDALSAKFPAVRASRKLAGARYCDLPGAVIGSSGPFSEAIYSSRSGWSCIDASS
jgi:hypothetical protein